jgi:hypothetical protein
VEDAVMESQKRIDQEYEEAVHKWTEYFFGPQPQEEDLKQWDGKQFHIRRGGSWVPVQPLVRKNGQWVPIK